MSRSVPAKPAPESSTERNQYIPSFIASKPFYASSLDDSDYLQHQRLKAEPKDTLDKAKWYDRGKKSGPAATKYRKGACENCGSASHKTKECLYRPRKTGAKWTGKDIQADEVVESVNLGWDAKRDRWNGYDAREYDQVVQDYNDLETLKKQTLAASSSAPDGDSEQQADPTAVPDALMDGDRIAEETDMGRTQPTSTRQLRLREDTAKYLLNLDLDSAKYDPKTRSMDAAAATGAEGVDVSDGFVRKSDAEAFERAQRYAWETQQAAPPTADTKLVSSSSDEAKKVHLQANPTEGALLLKKKESADAEAKLARQKYLAEKYGAAIPTPANSSITASSSVAKPTILSSEQYIEYDAATGRPKNAPPQATPRSKYAEDVLQNNHTSVWGSWWRNFQWGYACCHSTVRNSYCTGEQGKRAFDEAEGLRTGLGLVEGPRILSTIAMAMFAGEFAGATGGEFGRGQAGGGKANRELAGDAHT
ncbi:hypothetical protein DV737_g3844, partial [Chaetothyriales sp. CBS 132003]